MIARAYQNGLPLLGGACVMDGLEIEAAVKRHLLDDGRTRADSHFLARTHRGIADQRALVGGIENAVNVAKEFVFVTDGNINEISTRGKRQISDAFDRGWDLNGGYRGAREERALGDLDDRVTVGRIFGNDDARIKTRSDAFHPTRPVSE